MRWCACGCRCGSKTDAQNGVRKNATWRRWKTVSAPSSMVSCNRLTAPCTRDITTRTVPLATLGTPNSLVRSHPRRFHGAWAQQPQHPSVTWLRPWYLLHSRCASVLPPTFLVSCSIGRHLMSLIISLFIAVQGYVFVPVCVYVSFVQMHSVNQN